VFGGDQGAGEQHVGEGRIGGDHQQQLRGVGGDQLLPVGIAAVEQAAARAMAGDLAVGGQLDFVADGEGTFLAFRIAGGDAAVGQFDLVVPAEGGDDGAVPAFNAAYNANRASIFAAQMKSFSERPPMACVV
jgi:hypothetical protein